jgi:hypothetical protein
MHKLITVLFLSMLINLVAVGQSCLQPGALVSIINRHFGKYEYIIFKFIKPHPGKGTLTTATSDLFVPTKNKKNTYHRISFSNITHFCYDKLNLQLPDKKLLQFKIQQQEMNIVSYVFELAEGAKITAHYASQQQDFYFVKIRIE